MTASLENIAAQLSDRWREDQQSIAAPHWESARRHRNWEYYVPFQIEQAWDSLTEDVRIIAYLYASRERRRDAAPE